MSMRRTLRRLPVTLLLGALLVGAGGSRPARSAPQFDAWFVCTDRVSWYYFDPGVPVGTSLDIVVSDSYPGTVLGSDSLSYGGGLSTGTIVLVYEQDIPSVLKVTLYVNGVNTVELYAEVPICNASFVDDTVACLATAALAGSPQESGLDTLRAFRDDVLDTTALGRSVVRAYYALSPPVAAYLVRHETARDAVRGALIPVIYALGHPWPTTAAAFAAACLVTLLVRRRRTRRR